MFAWLRVGWSVCWLIGCLRGLVGWSLVDCLLARLFACSLAYFACLLVVLGGWSFVDCLLGCLLIACLLAWSCLLFLINSSRVQSANLHFGVSRAHLTLAKCESAFRSLMDDDGNDG